ncbi:MAG: hypothetical protein ACKO6K_11345, partial [Chitinophagaceae bacterium]
TNTNTILTVSGVTGTIQWQQSTNGGSTWANVTTGSGFTTTSFTTANLTATTQYRVLATNGACTATSNVSTVTVSSAAVGGTVTGSQTVCAGTNTTTLTVGGFTSAVSKWQSASNSTFTADVQDISSTSNQITVTNLSATTFYRAVISNGACTAFSSTGTVTVNQPSVAGSISGATSVCPGTNSTLLTLANATGTTYQWQSSSTLNGTYANITGATATTYTASNLSANTYYQVVVKNGVCAAVTTTPVMMTVYPAAVGGTMAGSDTVCSGSSYITLTISGNVGTITQWESSPVANFTSGVVTISNTTNSLNAIDLTSTTYYRALITNGSCTAYSSIGSVVVNQPTAGGTISGGKNVCITGNSTLLTLSGQVGSVIRWESSADVSFANPQVINNTTTSYTATNLTTNTYFQAIVYNKGCGDPVPSN